MRRSVVLVAAVLALVLAAGVQALPADAAADARLRVPDRVYAGYLSVFTLESRASLSGAQVLLQRRVGRSWKTVVKTAYRRDGTELVAKLPTGRQRLRARVEAGDESFEVLRTLTVRRGGRRAPSARDDGPYAARKPPPNSTLRFRVAGGGRTLRGFKASLTAFCVGPTPPDNRFVAAVARLRSARIAPDGSVTGLVRLKSGARVLLTGRLRHRRLRGEVSMSFSTCAGSRSLDTVRR